MSGKISRRARTCATSRGILSPALTTSLSFVMMTLPLSIAAGRPAICSSPTIGPGLNGVSPSRTQMSSGARSPPRAGEGVFVFSSSLNSLNGLTSAVITAVWPSMSAASASRPLRFAAASLSASLIRLFFATVIDARPARFFRIPWNWGAGMPWMFARPTTLDFSNLDTRSFTISCLYGATWAKVIPSQELHGRAHRRLDVDRGDIVASALELPQDAPHEGVQVVRDVLCGHVARADRGVERPAVLRPHADRVPHVPDHVRRVRGGRHGPRHLAARAED